MCICCTCVACKRAQCAKNESGRGEIDLSAVKALHAHQHTCSACVVVHADAYACECVSCKSSGRVIVGALDCAACCRTQVLSLCWQSIQGLLLLHACASLVGGMLGGYLVFMVCVFLCAMHVTLSAVVCMSGVCVRCKCWVHTPSNQIKNVNVRQPLLSCSPTPWLALPESCCCSVTRCCEVSTVAAAVSAHAREGVHMRTACHVFPTPSSPTLALHVGVLPKRTLSVVLHTLPL